MYKFPCLKTLKVQRTYQGVLNDYSIISMGFNDNGFLLMTECFNRQILDFEQCSVYRRLEIISKKFDQY